MSIDTTSHPPVDASTAPVSLSVLTVKRGAASKRLLVGAHGQPIKDTSSLAITAGLLEHVQIEGLQGLQALLTGILPTQALVHGVVTGSQPGHVARLITTERLKRASPGTFPPETIARSLEFLSYPAERFVLYFDRDVDPADPTHAIRTADELIALLTPLLPGLDAAGRLSTTSTTSAIRSKATHDWLIPPTGFHLYLIAQGNLSRFVELLKIRLWNAGYGYCRLASPNKQTGVAALLERAAVDLAVFSPERLDYVAGARIDKSAPFFQDREPPLIREGTVFNLDALPDVTPEERQAYEARLAAAKATLAPERHAQVAATIHTQQPDLPDAAVEGLVSERLQHHEDGLLLPDFLLYFFHRSKAVAVHELSKDYDGLRLADPAEPDYREGTDAIFHWHNGHWLINSFAHGQRPTYRATPTPPPAPDDDDMANLLQRVQATTDEDHETPPDSVLAKAIAHDWRDTLAFDLTRHAFLRYGDVPGIFREVDDIEVDAALLQDLERRLPAGVYTKTLRNVKYLVRARLHTRMTSGPSTLIPFTNGVLDLATRAWHAHSPDFHLTWCLPYAYDDTATCPLTQAWLLEACRGRADQVEVLRAFLKAVLCGRTDLQKFPELVGPGGSGKSTFAKLAQAVVGLANVGVTQLKLLESNRFETSNLIHKRLVVITDAEKWAGQVNVLKAWIGGDPIRLERKNVQQYHYGVAEGLILVCANESITSTDYTSGLDRRRIAIPFLHQPATPRLLLDIKGDHFEGELVPELAGVVKWALDMPDAAMRRALLDADSVAPTIARQHAHALLQTNPLAEWINDKLTLDPAPGEKVPPDYRAPGVKVGIARLADRSNRYECEDVWLYPNYKAYCNATGGGDGLSLRRFRHLLLDLLTAQLHLDTVQQRVTNKGSVFFGIRFRRPADDENESTQVDTYRPRVPFLITGYGDTPDPPATPDPSPGEGLKTSSEGWSEGLEGVDYGSEGLEDKSRARVQRKTATQESAAVQQTSHPPRARAYMGGSQNGANPSLPTTARGNPSSHPSPIPHSPPAVRDAAARNGGTSEPSPRPHPSPDAGVQAAARAAGHPPCFACQGTRFWHNARGMALCTRCYPPPLEGSP